MLCLNNKQIFSRWLFILLLIIFGNVFFVTSSAKAAPVAYTATGQKQLFPRVLSALGRTDYIEPAAGSLLSPPLANRQSLLGQRTASGFGAETNNMIKATRTPLSALLSRSITLEGDDLWTSYLAHQFALERARRHNLTAVLKVYCERGFGIEECDPKKAARDPKKAARLKDAAFVKDPYVHNEQRTFLRGILAAASSGYDEEIRLGELRKQRNNNGNETVFPASYSYGIAGTREKLKGKDILKTFDKMVYLSTSEFLNKEVDPTLYDGLDFDKKTGVVKLSLALPKRRSLWQTAFAQEKGRTNNEVANYIQTYTKKLVGLAEVPARLFSTYSGALKDYKIQKEGITNPVTHSIADFNVRAGGGVIAKNAGGQQKRTIGPLRANIERPLAAKDEAIKEVVRAIPDMEKQAVYATAEAGSIVGNVRQRYSLGNTQNKVAGVRSDQKKVQVAGTSDRTYVNEYPTSRGIQSPNDNLSPYYLDARGLSEVVGLVEPSGYGYTSGNYSWNSPNGVNAAIGRIGQ